PLSDAEADRTPLADFDVARAELYREDTWRPWFARLRREAPVHYCRDSLFGPYWSISRYEDVLSVELDPATFSSANGIALFNPPSELRRPSFIDMDPPRHTEQRRTVAPLMSPSHLAKLEATIRARACEILDALPLGETFDWVERVSVELTTQMLATLFDVPWEDRRKLTYWSDVTICSIHDRDAPVHSEQERAVELGKMAAYFGALWRERQNAPPRPDLVSMLAHGEHTRDMPPAEFTGNLALLIVGGNDTTRNAISGAVLALNEFPDEWRKLRANPALMSKFVPEVIRWQTPIIYMRRTATRDVELHGQTIRAGDKVAMWYISANRDEDAIPRADDFIVDRERPRAHLSFGAGIHRCVGDRLGEMQLRILWEEVLKRFELPEVAGRVERGHNTLMRTIRKLPVRLRPAGAPAAS
ncbi:MAG: cytochrome P450, partial [Acetobacteraceae bacterium]|nr:cytochrome P450 [Acetobacteraceae bacterium]